MHASQMTEEVVTLKEFLVSWSCPQIHLGFKICKIHSSSKLFSSALKMPQMEQVIACNTTVCKQA